MSQPPQDALDLYAFGVQYCEERGIPLSHIRVTWVQDAGNGAFKYHHYKPDADWQWLMSADPDYIKIYRDAIKGLYLSFPSSGDAECYSLSGVTPFEGQETCLVWVNPGHRFHIIGMSSTNDACSTTVLCSRCNLVTALQHGWDLYHQQSKIWDNHQEALIPPGVQLPACIKRHVPRLFSTYRFFAICHGCSQIFEPPAPENINSPIKITHDYIKSLGRCPGAP